jgi:hypothetical protein
MQRQYDTVLYFAQQVRPQDKYSSFASDFGHQVSKASLKGEDVTLAAATLCEGAEIQGSIKFPLRPPQGS